MCSDYWAAAYGVTESAENSILADARKGNLRADAEWEDAEWKVPHDVAVYHSALEV